MRKLDSKLIFFVFESETTAHVDKISRNDFAKLIGKDRFDRLRNLFDKIKNFNEEIYVTEEEAEDLVIIYYWDSSFKDKTIKNIEEEFLIKTMLE